MMLRVVLTSLGALDLYLVWSLLQADLGTSRPFGRDLHVLAIAACTLLIVTTLTALLRHGPRRREILIVRNGSIRRQDGALAAATDGRAVPVVVQEGHVAVLERLGRYARTLGPGKAVLRPGETIHKVILTSPRPLVGTVDCSTQDSVPITAEFELDARILAVSGIASPRRTALPAGKMAMTSGQPARGFPWSQEAVIRAAYAVPGWELATLNAAKQALRQHLAGVTLGDIFDLEERRREARPFSVIADHIRLELNDQCRAWGAEVLRFQLDRVKMPTSIEQSILAGWKTRHPLSGTEAVPAGQPADDETASLGVSAESKGAALRLVPVLGRGSAASLREAIRQRLGYLTTDGVEIDGERYVIRPASDPASSTLSLRPDATYFALGAVGDNLACRGVSEGDFVLFESQSEARNGSLIATLIDGDLGIKWFTRKPDHSLLEPVRAAQPAVILTDSGAQRDGLFTQYADRLPPVEYWPADDARILGRAVLVFQPVTPRARPEASEQVANVASQTAGDSPPAEAECGEPAEDSAAGTAPDEPVFVIPSSEPDEPPKVISSSQNEEV